MAASLQRRIYIFGFKPKFEMQLNFMMVVVRFQGEFYVVRDPAAMGYENGLWNLHVRVERPTMGCPTWLRFIS